MHLGDQVSVKGSAGTIRYIGTTQFAPGKWIGVELFSPGGKNDGSVNGVRYFDCGTNYGVFVRESAINLPNSQPSSRNLLRATPTLGPVPYLRPRTPSSTASSPQLSPLSPVGEGSNIHRIVDKLQVKLKAATEDVKRYKLQAKEVAKLLVDHEKAKKAIDDLQQRYDELKCDHNILQEELELTKQLEEEIKEAMADHQWTSDDVATILARNQQLEATTGEGSTLDNGRSPSSDSSAELLAAQEIISQLQAQLEMTLDLETLVEKLTSQNEDLVAQIADLNAAIEELQELHEIDKSLEENQLEVENQLRRDITNLQDVLRKEQLVVVELERKSKYMEAKVVKLKSQVDIVGDQLINVTETTLANDPMIDDLQLNLRKVKINHHVEKFRAQVAEGKLAVAQARFGSPPNASRLFVVRDLLALAQSLLEAVSTDPTTKLPILTHIFGILAKFLERLATICEFNYANTFVGMNEVLESLENNLDLAASAIMGANPLAIDPLLFPVFITQMMSLIKGEATVVGGNKDLYYFCLQLVMAEVSMYRDLVTQVRSHFLAVSKKGHEHLESVVAVEGELKMAILSLMFLENETTQKLNEMETLGNHDLAKIGDPMAVVTAFSRSLAILISWTRPQNTILTPEPEDVVDDVLASPQMVSDLTIILDAYKKIILQPVEAVESPSKTSVLDVVAAKTTLAAIPHTDVVEDYKLNIEMLETSLRQLDVRRVTQLDALSKEVEAARKDAASVTSARDEAVARAHALEAEVAALVKANSLYDVMEFESLAYQQEHTEKLAIFEEIQTLRMMVDVHTTWGQRLVKLPPLERKKWKRNQGLVPLRDAVNMVRDVRPKLLNICKVGFGVDRPEYLQLVMEEKWTRYTGEMNWAVEQIRTGSEY